MKNKISENKDIKFCVIVPTYNNAGTLHAVLTKIAEHNLDIIIVDDGSTEETKNILANFSQHKILSHEVNQGKGMALRTAFAKALELGYDYGITIDSDGQHDADDIPRLISAVNANPGTLVMGSRNMNQEGIPSKSNVGNRISSFWFWVETGTRLSDTQTGFRAYPLAPMEGIKWYTRKFEFEIEVIARLAWRNVKIIETPISVQYMEDRVSHFRPARDFTRVGVMHTVLTTLGLLFFLPRLIIWNFSFKGLWNQIKQEFAKGSENPLKLAGSVGLGLFFGIFPIWGFQMAVAYAVASLFRLNRVIVLFSSNISIPPVLPFIIYFSFKFGGLFVAQKVELLDFESITLSSIHQHVVQYAVGASLLAAVVGVVGFVLVWALASVMRRTGNKD